MGVFQTQMEENYPTKKFSKNFFDSPKFRGRAATTPLNIRPQKQTREIYLRILCKRPRQSVATISSGDERRNIVTSLSKLVLGAKQPVASHIKSQPRSMLELYTISNVTRTND